MRALGLTLAAVALLAGCGTGGKLTNVRVAGTAEAQQLGAISFANAIEQGRPLLQIGIERIESNTLTFEESTKDGVVTYMTPDKIAVILDGGLLFATKGFGGDILASDVRESEAMVRSRRNGITTRFHTFLDGEDQAVTRTYVCEVINQGAREIQISTFGGEFIDTRTTLMEENCRSLDQEFSNLYWLRAGTSRIVQSRQWAGETTGHLVLRIVIP